MKVIAFGASTSKSSINKTFATYAANLIDGAQVEVLDLNDFELPIYSEDLEKEIGKPQAAQDFYDKLGSADALVISYAEHNGSYTAAYKNLFDWCSRINMAVFQGKPAVYLSTSLGPGGANSVLQAALGSAPFFGAELKGSFSLPSFLEKFDSEAKEIKDEALRQELSELMSGLRP